ncbi:WD40 repeat-like protein [Auriscalpium vulgare]|uniref:WD40 repeat-like protein n=1 Tax=Auriscalpium vulgare TaxID=40419 RepID=A0ACB8RCY4_9AGAM|nr:WD40 repeat-like protein [Auriscalpium vulgare]
MGVFSTLRRRFTPKTAQLEEKSAPLREPAAPVDPGSGSSPPATDESPSSSTKAERAPGKQPKGPSCKCILPPNGQRRNLVVCIDGTANQFSEKNTNVVELYSRLDKNEHQLTYYDSGIGTYVRDSKWSPRYWKQVASNAIDMAIAWNFKKIVLSAYQWLSENYQEGDKIFLFGFSRGAYQARVIAGMIEKVGLLHKGNNNQIPFAYELYVSTTSNQKRADTEASLQSKTKTAKSTKMTEKQEALCARFKQTLSRPQVRVHFVGTWDTVSSIGFARGPSLPETTTGMTHVCVYRHALALDERRGKFGPEYANGGAGPPTGEGAEGDVKEVWFLGSHSDIGGGILTNIELDHFGAALRWMSYEAITHGLRMSPRQGVWMSYKPNLSVGRFYTCIDWIPYRRLSYKDGDDTTRRPHRGQARQVKHGQLIHESVFESIKDGYRPLALLPDGLTWDGDNTEMREPDPYSSAVVTISALEIDNQDPKSLPERHRHTLTTLASTEPGRVSLRTAPGAGGTLLRALVNEHSLGGDDSEPHRRNIEVLAEAVTIATEYSGPLAQPRELISVLKQTPKTAKVYKDFIDMFRQLRLCRGHKSSISSALFSPDGKCIVSGSKDETVRIWDAETGQPVGTPLEGHVGWVWSVAFSPDGRRVVSGLADKTIRIWDTETGKPVGRPLEGHTALVGSVAFSSNGKHIVSGSKDETIRIWDADLGQPVGKPLEGHTGCVMLVAFSPDGRLMVSGAEDETVRIWDVETGQPVGTPLKGHTNDVNSVAFSPNGRRIVSGSDDRTIRIWDVETGKLVGRPLEGHTDRVMSVAFSPDSTRVVSGSDDCAIRIWDAETGQPMGKPLEGHTDRVMSVAFSPDGTRVVSGSFDNTIRIWDAENC